MQPVPFLPPTRFRVLRRLGEGGMGVVYEAVDQETGVRVALKTLRSTSSDGIARFKREFRALQDLQHKNLVSLGELYGEHGTWFFTMELVEGFDFLEYVRPSDPARAPTGLDALAHTELQSAPEEAQGTQVTQASLGGRTTVSTTLSRNLTSNGRIAAEGADEKRLRDALTQLSRALLVLHDAQKVHRDIKPSNIRVTPDGRLVLMDFGVVLDVDPAPHTTELKVVGTAAYMAPEQAAAKPVGPEADWYSVGCLLYEALTGCLPFRGAPLQILMAKQRAEPQPPRTLVPGVPADLDALCMDLLRFDPSARPNGRQVYRRVQGTAPAIPLPDSPRPAAATTTSQTPQFVGRTAQLQLLRAAFEKTRSGSAVTIFLEGESGVGKSALVRRFVETVVAEGPAVVLSGRCRERESVPYKAFDGIIDALSLVLPKLVNWKGVLPRRVGLLAQVFPVLRRIEDIATLERPGRDILDPLEQRSRVFGACREMFTRLAVRHPVVLVIDDLQWADADSLALLAEIMRPPEPPPLLLLTTTRLITRASVPPGSQAPAPKRQVAHGLEGDVRHLRVEPLDDDEARELAGILTRRASQDVTVDTAAIVREANGHPLFIDELVRHAALGGQTGGAVRLDDALWARISRLDESSRHLVQLVAVAGMPMTVEALARGAQMDVPAANKELALLRVANLVRTSGGHRPDVAEPYHDRVREAVLAKLSPEEKSALHTRIALALETEAHPDPEALSVHWREAGDAERAASHAERAGIAAETALAFDHAARLFRGALELRHRDAGDGEELALRIRLATALANAGLCADAAREYQIAAARSSEGDAVDLRGRAAEQLLRAGLIDEGLDVTRVVLAALGMTLPRTPLQAMAAYLFHRLLLWFRGLGFTEREPRSVSARELQVVDVCWSLSFSLSLVDTVRGGDFQARNLLLALKVGEPYRVARALAMETSFGASMGGDPWEVTEQKIQRAETLSKRVGNPHAIAWSMATAGCAAYLGGRFKLALERLDDAQAQLRECAGAWSEIIRARTFALNALAQLGDVEELARRMTLYLRESQEHGDLHAATNFRIGYATLAWLARDNAKGAHDETEDAMRHWSKGGFHLEHYYALLGRVQADLYEGNGDAAWERVTQAWRPLQRSFLLRVQRLRLHARYLRARAAIAVAARDESRRRSLLAEASRLAKQCGDERCSDGPPIARLLRASIAVARGDAAAAQACLAEAAPLFAQADMQLHDAATRYAAGALRGGIDGEATRDAAARWMLARTVKAPAKIVRMLAPGLDRGE